MPEGFSGLMQKESIIADAMLLESTHRHQKMIRLSLSTVRCSRLILILPSAASGAKALVQAWLVTMAKDTIAATTLPLNRLRWQNSFEKDCVTVTSGHAPSLSAIDFDQTLEEIGIVEGSELVLEEEPYDRELHCCYANQRRGPPPLLYHCWIESGGFGWGKYLKSSNKGLWRHSTKDGLGVGTSYDFGAGAID